MVAVYCKNTAITSLLISLDANVNAVNYRNSSALLISAYRGSKEIAELLISAGADIYAVDEDGLNATAHAALKHEWELVDYFVSCGIDIDFSKSMGSLELGMAVYKKNMRL